VHYRIKGMGTAKYRCDSWETIIGFNNNVAALRGRVKEGDRD
jgi:hypothetical protein